MTDKKADLSRRDFVKSMAVGGLGAYFASAGLASTVFKKALTPPVAHQDMELGEVTKIDIKCISETSWFDNATLVKDIKEAGGLLVNQYSIPWPPFGDLNTDNAGGYAALLKVTEAGGKEHTILLDSGWKESWMDECFEREGIDKMLQNGEIEFQVISHEHFDHFWGIASTVKHCPDIKMYIPSEFYQEGYDLLDSVGHTGERIKIYPDEPVEVFPGCVIANFDIPIITRVRGENVFYFNLKDKGICTVTGCCHPGIITLLEYAKKTFKAGNKVYGVYGGLHISPFEDWDPQYDDLVLALGDYGIEKLGCNHCTGYITAQKMIDVGLPVVRGTAQNRSAKDIYLGNGDTLEFS